MLQLMVGMVALHWIGIPCVPINFAMYLVVILDDCKVAETLRYKMPYIHNHSAIIEHAASKCPCKEIAGTRCTEQAVLS